MVAAAGHILPFIVPLHPARVTIPESLLAAACGKCGKALPAGKAWCAGCSDDQHEYRPVMMTGKTRTTHGGLP